MDVSDRLRLSVFLVIAMLIFTPIAAFAGAERTALSGVMYFVDYWPSPDLWSWNSSEDGTHFRHLMQWWWVETDDERLNGDLVIDINGNFHYTETYDIYGPVFGTILIENAGGAWLGSYVGTREYSGYSTYKVTLHGSGGYAGMLAKLALERIDPGHHAPITIVGEILEAGN